MTEQEIIEAVNSQEVKKAYNKGFSDAIRVLETAFENGSIEDISKKLDKMDALAIYLARHLNNSIGNREEFVDLYLKAVKNKWRQKNERK